MIDGLYILKNRQPPCGVGKLTEGIHSSIHRMSAYCAILLSFALIKSQCFYSTVSVIYYELATVGITANKNVVAKSQDKIVEKKPFEKCISPFHIMSFF